VKNRPVLTIIFLTVFIDLLGFGMVLPLLPVWAERLTASKYLIILLGSAYSLAQFVFAPVWGRLSDAVGRRPVLLVSLGGGGLAYLLMAFADSLAMLYAARFLQGLFTAGGLAAAPALIADVTSDEERSRGMGLIGAAFGLGFIFGPAFGAALAQVSLGAPFFAAAALSLGNLTWAAAMLPETLDSSAAREGQTRFLDLQKLRETLTSPALGLLFFLLFINTFAFSNLEQTFTLFVQERLALDAKSAGRTTGFLLAYIGIVAVMVQGFLIRPLSRRFGDARLLLAGILMTGTALLLMPLPRGVGGLMLVSTLMSAGWGLVNPCTSSLISRSAGRDRQGGVLGLSQGLASLARIAGPVWGGFAFSRLGIAWPYWSGGVILLLSFAVAMARLLPASQPVRGGAGDV